MKFGVDYNNITTYRIAAVLRVLQDFGEYSLSYSPSTRLTKYSINAALTAVLGIRYVTSL